FGRLHVPLRRHRGRALRHGSGRRRRCALAQVARRRDPRAVRGIVRNLRHAEGDRRARGGRQAGAPRSDGARNRAPHPSAPRRAHRMSQGPRRILVVDDSPTVLAMIEDLLVAQGYQVATASDGEQALIAITAERPDMIISDVNMPRMSGLELARSLKHDPHTRAIPVLMLTASVEEKDLIESLGMGVDDYVR